MTHTRSHVNCACGVEVLLTTKSPAHLARISTTRNQPIAMAWASTLEDQVLHAARESWFVKQTKGESVEHFVYFRLPPPVECSALGYVRRSHNAVSEAITISYFYETLYARWQNYKKFFTPAGKTKVTRVWRPVVSWLPVPGPAAKHEYVLKSTSVQNSRAAQQKGFARPPTRGFPWSPVPGTANPRELRRCSMTQ